MNRWLNVRVTAKRFDEVGALVVGVALLAGCTALSWLMLPELPVRTTFILGASLGAAWMGLAGVAGQLRRL
jgi:hypothetical protein